MNIDGLLTTFAYMLAFGLLAITGIGILGSIMLMIMSDENAEEFEGLQR